MGVGSKLRNRLGQQLAKSALRNISFLIGASLQKIETSSSEREKMYNMKKNIYQLGTNWKKRNKFLTFGKKILSDKNKK